MIPAEHILFIDQHEPTELVEMLKTSHKIVVGPLNASGKADYLWQDALGNTRQWERKQIAEILSDLDAVEEQVNLQMDKADEQGLVIEGLAKPVPAGVMTFRHHSMGEFCPILKTRAEHWCLGHMFERQPGLWARWEGWKWGMRMAGIVVVETVSIELTAQALSAAVRASLKPEHTTLKRYLTPHIPPFSPNIHVENLSRLKGCGIGPVQAQKLVADFGTFYDAVTAPKSALAKTLGGEKKTENFLHTLGRME